MKVIPCWLYVCICDALVGKIYPEIRVIAVRYTRKRELLIRYYLDRDVTDEDINRANEVMEYILENISSKDDITHYESECIYTKDKLGDIDTLDERIYARCEDDFY